MYIFTYAELSRLIEPVAVQAASTDMLPDYLTEQLCYIAEFIKAAAIQEANKE